MSPQSVESIPPSDPGGYGEARPARTERVEGAVRRFQAGIDREASFRLLHEVYFHPLRSFFSRKGFSPEECQDLTQETFLSIYKGLKSYRPEGRFEGWLYRLATNTFLMRRRETATGKRSGEEVPYEEAAGSPAVVPSSGRQLEDVLVQERHQAIVEAVRELPEQMRKCLTLRLYHDMTYDEIATVMKLKINTVKVHLFQARKKLKERLSDLVLDEMDS